MELSGRQQPHTMVQTRDRIIEVASSLFSERTYLGVSMANIAERLGISKPALYHHFASKIQIYADVLAKVATDLDAVMIEAARTEGPSRRLHQLVKNYLDLGMRERNLINALVVRLIPDDAGLRARIASLRRKLTDRVQPVVEDVLAGLCLPKVIDTAHLADMLVAMMDGLLIEHYFLDKPIDSGRVADQILTVLGLHDESPTSLQARTSTESPMHDD